jgi:hypothetical protein
MWKQNDDTNPSLAIILVKQNYFNENLPYIYFEEP